MTRASDTARTLSGGAVFNEGSNNVDLRVESNGNANMLFVNGGNDTVSIGGNAVTTAQPTLAIVDTTNGAIMSMRGQSPKIHFDVTSSGVPKILTDGAGIEFKDGTLDAEGNVDLKIDSSGNVHVATTSTNQANVGISLNANGNITATRDGGIVGLFNRKSSNGEIVRFARDQSTIGLISGTIGLVIGTADTGLGFETSSADAIIPQNPTTVAGRDNAIDLGNSSNRFDDIYASNTSIIGTSDKNEKEQIEELTDVEKKVATALKGLVRKFKWKSAVAEKGDKARTHIGVMAQDIQDAFTAESLDASKYAMFCSDTWWEKEISVDAVEAVKEVKDEEGNVTTEAVEAKEAYTYMDNKYEATDGYTERTRLGVRYSELLAFIISAI